LETTTVVDAAAASLWLEPGADDATTLLATGLKRVHRLKDARRFARALLAGDEYAFAGYARWQINDRWDVLAGNESTKPYRIEERFFARLMDTTDRWPKAWATSLAFRWYLAQRDVFVREAARSVFRLRRLLRAGKTAEAAQLLGELRAEAREFAPRVQAGRRAARGMWRRTRSAEREGPNETVLRADARRLAEWIGWLQQARRQPELAWLATPVCGAWQLQFVVHNPTPAVQRVVVEQQDPDGTWREIAARYTIEFRAYAARPRTRIKREFTVPAGSPADKFRLAVRGIGQVAISHALLTNGVEAHRGPDFRRPRMLGQRAPARGVPDPSRDPVSWLELSWPGRA
jgi:hypothetical protein